MITMGTMQATSNGGRPNVSTRPDTIVAPTNPPTTPPNPMIPYRRFADAARFRSLVNAQNVATIAVL